MEQKKKNKKKKKTVVFMIHAELSPEWHKQLLDYYAVGQSILAGIHM